MIFSADTKIRRYEENVRRFQEKSERTKYDRGRICPFKWDHFIVPRPTTILGHDISKGRRSFGEILRGAPIVSVREKLGVIDGPSCRVLEAIGVVDRRRTFDVRVWIDTERDFRPLRIERYHSIRGKNRWRVTSKVIENIRLKKIDGVWFPVDGMITSFSTKKRQRPRGMTATEYRSLTRAKHAEVSIYTQAPGPTGPVRVKVYGDTVRINKGIDPGKFTIEFPQGCRVYDDFLQSAYVVGEKGNQRN